VSDDLLTAPDAGARAIRGGTLRVVGYGVSLALTAAASLVLTRHLGLEGFGRFMVVVALLGIVGGLSDAGILVIGQREYVRAQEGRRSLLGVLLGLRLLITPAAVVLAVAFAFLAGYSGAQVGGLAIAGAGLLFANAAGVLTLPLAAQLRLGAVTAIEVGRSLALAAGLVALVAAGAGLLPLFAAYLASGVVTLLAALAFVPRGDRVAPHVDVGEWRRIGRLAAPVALALVVNVIYLRVLVIQVSLLSDETQTGMFGTSYRVLEIFLGVPQMMAGAAFPILAHAGTTDESRLAYVLQRLVEATLLMAVAIALALAMAAEPIVRIIGGEEYAAAAPVLALQSVAVLGAFLTQVWALALVAIDRQRDTAIVNGVGLAFVMILGFALIPVWDARGAAAAAIAGELVLAGAALTLLVRARPSLRPSWGRPLRILLAGGAGAACALLGLPAAVEATCALAVFGALVFALRAVPWELLQAFRRPPGGQ
jgi:O-antigen/teichoic acid export membrane protein